MKCAYVPIGLFFALKKEGERRREGSGVAYKRLLTQQTLTFDRVTASAPI